MLRYTVLRVLVFAGCLGLLWLLGLRGQRNEVFLVAGAAVLSLLISYYALRPWRERASVQLARRVDAHKAMAEARRRAAEDETSEDAEIEQGSPRRGEDEFR